MAKRTIGVVGTGIMGAGIARNFLKAGHPVHVWNRTAERLEPLVVDGAKASATPQEVAAHADIVFEVTANDESSRMVWTGDDGILAVDPVPDSLITCATISVAWTDELAGLCRSRGLSFFDMPMTGGRIGAENGQLTLLAGGDQAKLIELQEHLTPVTKEVKYFGPAGSGMRYKLVLNTLQAIHIAGFGEAMRLARAAGLDEQQVGEELVERPGGIPTEFSWRDYPAGPQPINFAVEWIAKDLGYAAALSGDATHPLSDLTLKQYQRKIEAGEGQADWTSIALPE